MIEKLITVRLEDIEKVLDKATVHLGCTHEFDEDLESACQEIAYAIEQQT
jgi:hypothetical protein